LNTLLFADDQVVLADSEDNLQRAVYKLSNIVNKYNLKMSAKKTKVLAFVGINSLRAKIMINGKIIEQVNSFNYLGCNLFHISPKDFDNKLIKFQQLIGTTKKTFLKRVRTETILKFYKTLVIPILLNGYETWTLMVSQLKRLEAAEMRLPLAGHTLLDHKRNKDIRKKLNIENITSIISTYRKNWYEHVTRMPPHRTPHRLLFYKPSGRRNVGRPKKTLDGPVMINPRRWNRPNGLIRKVIDDDDDDD
jgi:hypothetical protein